MEKNERSCHGDIIVSINKNAMVSTLKCPAFDIKQSPTGRLPEDHQVRTHAYLSLSKAQSCFLASFICPCMLWFECMTQRIHS